MDGSKASSAGYTGRGIYIPNFKICLSKRLTNKLPVYSGKVTTEEIRPNRVVICSDSASALSSLVSLKSEWEHLITEIQSLLKNIQTMEIMICS